MASRANHYVLLSCALLCAAAMLHSHSAFSGATDDQPAKPVVAPSFPVASDARLAGDGKQTRFILDLDKAISFRAFPLADPYRVVLDIPQVSFQLSAGTGVAGRGLIKAFRYGLVMPGGSRIVFDLNGPARFLEQIFVRMGQQYDGFFGIVPFHRQSHITALVMRAIGRDLFGTWAQTGGRHGHLHR